jgi:hypothetical protein
MPEPVTTTKVIHEEIKWPQPHEDSYKVCIICQKYDYAAGKFNIIGSKIMTVSHTNPTAGDITFNPPL